MKNKFLFKSENIITQVNQSERRWKRFKKNHPDFWSKKSKDVKKPRRG